MGTSTPSTLQANSLISWTQVYQQAGGALGDRIRDGITFAGQIAWWKKNPVTAGVRVLRSADGVTFQESADLDIGNGLNPQRADQFAVPGDSWLYLIGAPAATGSGVSVYRTQDLINFAQRYGDLSVRATQNGAIGVYSNLPAPCRTDPLVGPAEDPTVYEDSGAAWSAFPLFGAGGILSYVAPAGFDTSHQICAAKGANLWFLDANELAWTNRHAALANVHRLYRWERESVLLYARFWQGAEPANTSRVYSFTDADVATERWAGQITGIVSDFLMPTANGDLWFTTVSNQVGTGDLRIYRAYSLTAAPILVGQISTANIWDHSAFLAYLPATGRMYVSFFRTGSQLIYQSVPGARMMGLRMRR